MDWGVCINPTSPRAGSLTFEHHGCEQFESQGPIEKRNYDGEEEDDSFLQALRITGRDDLHDLWLRAKESGYLQLIRLGVNQEGLEFCRSEKFAQVGCVVW